MISASIIPSMVSLVVTSISLQIPSSHKQQDDEDDDNNNEDNDNITRNRSTLEADNNSRKTMVARKVVSCHTKSHSLPRRKLS